ncbi:MAG: preQ(1) synthase [Gemmatimonadetes bacterium]|nr:preQ(1) synthase [Gemmatimonadota bacterium]MDE3257495.1 preQ(1) synthase [Gemmatimonadota bacterium]
MGLVTTQNPQPDRPYTIEFVFPEFTAVLPVTSEPVFATVTIRYVPGGTCIETVSLKRYLGSFRNQATSYEAAVNRILDDLVAACNPEEMRVIGEFTVRGGIAATVTVDTVADGAADSGKERRIAE